VRLVRPGAIVYRVHRKFQHGLRTAYYRDVVRPRICETRPVRETSSDECEIHVLTSSQDWLNLLWALKTFYHFSGRHYALCIHNDGTLPATATAALRRHFPEARLISRDEADRAVLPTLEAYPLCLALRRSNMLSLKLFDFRHYLQSARMLLIDSDILFFREPLDLLRRIEDPAYQLNSVNADVASAYTVDPIDVRGRFGFELEPSFNSGLGLIHRDSLRLEWIEEFLSLPGVLGHFWRIEQTLFALCSYRRGAELLPEEYRVQLDGKISGSCKHFIGAIRQHMYGSGIRHLVRAGFLKSIAE
jgi:hypothetical protein